MGTFHAVCARMLRRDGMAIGLDPRFVIYDTDDQLTLMKQVFRDLDVPLQGGPIRPRGVLEALSRAKNDLEGADALEEAATTRYQEDVAKLAVAYERRLREAGALDFDDLLGRTVLLLETQPEVLARYQARWRYLHVDEYQDTNRAQYRIVRALAAAHHNLCVVGDDDQSIYAWRGADLRNILDFERDEPGATVVKLERNYRSTQLILEAAHAVVANNLGRKEKKLWTEKAAGRPIQRFEAYDEEEEAEWIARQVEALLGGRASSLTRRADEDVAFRPKDIAVLYRTNAQSRAIEEAFLRYGIRYQLIGGTRFYQRREVKDALAYLRILRSDRDRVSFERVINVPPRGLGDRSLEVLRTAARRTRGHLLERPGAGGRGRAAHADRSRPGRRGGLRGPCPATPVPGRAPAAAGAARRCPGGLRLPGDARGRHGGERGALAEPARASLGDDAVRRPRARRRAGPPARGDGPRRRPGQLRGRRRRGHADHAPRGEGAGVRRRLHRRPGGGDLPARPGPGGGARAGRPARARGGAPPRLRRHHPGQGAALPVACLAAGHVGSGGRSRHAVAFPVRDPGRPAWRARGCSPAPPTRTTSTSRSGRAARHGSARDPAARGARTAAGRARPPPGRTSGRRATWPPVGPPSRPARRRARSRPRRAGTFATRTPSRRITRMPTSRSTRCRSARARVARPASRPDLRPGRPACASPGSGSSATATAWSMPGSGRASSSRPSSPGTTRRSRWRSAPAA